MVERHLGELQEVQVILFRLLLQYREHTDQAATGPINP